jgi:hypothetical protein
MVAGPSMISESVMSRSPVSASSSLMPDFVREMVIGERKTIVSRPLPAAHCG